MFKRCIGSMATFPAREKSLSEVVSHIAPQLDVLYIYLNEYDEVPACLDEYNNIRPVLGKESHGNLSANGKMIYLDFEHEDSYVFILDDDVLYPADYADKMIEVLISMNNKVVLCVHGSVIPDYASWYFERTVVYDSKKKLGSHKAINLVGSGTCVYQSSSITMEMKDFTDKVFVDLKISMSALEQGVPLLAVERESNYIKFIPYDGLWEGFRTTYTHHTEILLSEDVWHMYVLKAVWKKFLDSESRGDWRQYVYEKSIDMDFANYVYGGSMPLSFRCSPVSLNMILKKLKIC